MNYDLKKQHQEYLEKAKEAEKFAREATDAFMRENWLNIAKGYRDLARQFLRE